MVLWYPHAEESLSFVVCFAFHAIHRRTERINLGQDPSQIETKIPKLVFKNNNTLVLEPQIFTEKCQFIVKLAGSKKYSQFLVFLQ